MSRREKEEARDRALREAEESQPSGENWLDGGDADEPLRRQAAERARSVVEEEGGDSRTEDEGGSDSR